MLGRNISLPKEPKRIICLVPSLTELLFDLGLDNRVVGITKFCIHPAEWFKSKTRIGGTKTVSFEKIKELDPDLIIANKEENTKEEIERLMEIYPVWVSDINTYSDALLAVKKIATICNKEIEGNNLIKQIEIKKKAFSSELVETKSVLYLIWKDPYMTVGKKTYINDIITILGYKNCYKEKRYKEISIEEIKQLNPQLIFLSSEPYPFKMKHLEEFNQLLPNTVCKIVDGELFSWYGSRLLKTFTDSIFI